MKKRGFEKISRKQVMSDFDFGKDLAGYYLEEAIKEPKRATSKSAGYDILSPYEFKLKSNQEIKLPTGLKTYMQPDEVLMIYPRSSLGFKYYARLANSTGLIDADYYNNNDNEGHIWVKLRNESDKVMEIEEGEAICQAVFQKYLLADDDSFDGDERKGGIGSTG